jgi:predicted Zn-dependent protease
MQQTPNLVLTPNSTNATRDDLVADVTDGILITEGEATADFQAQTGIIQGIMHEIKDGKVGRPVVGGAISYSTLDLWKNIIAIGGLATQDIVASSWFPCTADFERLAGMYPVKGEPPQRTSASIQAVAATITKQAVIDLRRKA